MSIDETLTSSPIRFLHAVGRSTLRQGITIPLIAQIGWLSQITKGESVPVTIIFSDDQSVTARVRRLNNAHGHLQFRYETREQAPLRAYLSQIFGGEVGRNSVLSVVETAPRTFEFQPVAEGQQKPATLSLYKPHFHNLARQDATKIQEFTELRDCFLGIPYDENHGQARYNGRIAENLRASGWRDEVRIVPEIGLRCDFEKNGIWLEVEFGNARTYYQDYIKFLLARKYVQARAGILLCPTNAFAQLLCDLGQRRAAARPRSPDARPPTYSGMMSYEKAMRELPSLEFMMTAPMIIAGIEIGKSGG